MTRDDFMCSAGNPPFPFWSPDGRCSRQNCSNSYPLVVSIESIRGGTDVLIVGINNGQLVKERKSPHGHVNVSSGLVMLMPKEEPYLLRNIGKENLDLLVIEVRK